MSAPAPQRLGRASGRSSSPAFHEYAFDFCRLACLRNQGRPACAPRVAGLAGVVALRDLHPLQVAVALRQRVRGALAIPGPGSQAIREGARPVPVPALLQSALSEERTQKPMTHMVPVALLRADWLAIP